MSVTSEPDPERHDLSPSAARDRYLRHRQTDASESSIDSWFYRLKLFVEWAEEQGIEGMSQLSGWDLDVYLDHRRGRDLAPSTLNSEMQTIKTWLEYLARIEVVGEELPGKVPVPQVPDGDESNDEFLSAERAHAMLEAYRSDDDMRATNEHVVVELLWWTGCRVGALLGLDVDDYDGDEQFVLFQHRPETGTPLKNDHRGERAVGLRDEVCEIVDEYKERNRDSVTDDHGRAPLVTTGGGRPAENTIRVWSYLATHPCVVRDCPHQHQRETCDFRHSHHASKCPSALSPHRIRTGSITWQRDCGLPAEVVSERVNASLEVIEKYYDQASARERMEQRRRPYLSELGFDQEDNTDV